jgi:hypothetical protein
MKIEYNKTLFERIVDKHIHVTKINSVTLSPSDFDECIREARIIYYDGIIQRSFDEVAWKQDEVTEFKFAGIRFVLDEDEPNAE